MLEDLRLYKKRYAKIRTLEELKTLTFAEEEKKDIDIKISRLKYYQHKIYNGLLGLDPAERELIFKVYMDTAYIFKSFYMLSQDLFKSYSTVRGIHKKALRKLEDWDKGTGLY